MKAHELSRNAMMEHQRRLKTSSPSPSPNPNPNGQRRHNHETIMIFGFEQYPFPNEDNNESTLLKTIVNLELSTEKLEKVIKLAHPNLIGLRKIVRSSPREDYQGSKHRSYYSFFYQTVSYSLRDLAQDPQKNLRLLNELRGTNLRQILMDVTEYLKEAGIYYMCRLQDIGVHRDGTIKIYLPPNTVFESNYNPNVHRAILSLAEWWDSVQGQFGYNKFKKDKKVIQLQPPRLSDNGDLQMDDPSMKSSTLERELGELLGDEEEQESEQNVAHLKQSSNSYASQLTKLGSVQLEKFKKIDEEVKFIRLRMNEKTKRNHKDSDVTMQKRDMGKPKSNLKLFDSQQMPKRQQAPEKPVSSFPRQPIQQNIHTINIYNHNAPPIPISPYPPSPKYNYQPYYDHNLDPEFFRDQDEQYSQDTYDIEFQNQFDIPNTTPSSNFRHTLLAPPERELSEYSEHCHKKNRDWGNENKQKQKQVMQMCNKNVTESAGPLQFKSFVNKIIKPQFLAKKSNIYEDPGEDGEQSEREREKEKEKEKERQALRRNEDGKKLNASSNHRHYSTDKGLGDLKKIFNKSVAEFDDSIRHDIKRINSQHDFTVNRGKPDGQIEQKVRRALQKTKNAIALLNRVKSSKGNIKTLSSQQT